MLCIASEDHRTKRDLNATHRATIFVLIGLRSRFLFPLHSLRRIKILSKSVHRHRLD
jgi:hypothetical protein